MFLRIAVSCALVCAVAAVEVAGTAGAKPGKNANLVKGKTAQKRPFKATVHKRAIDVKRFVVELRCKDGSRLVLFESGFLPSPLRKGRVHDYQFGRTDKVWIRGKLKNGTFRGRLRVKDRLGKGKNRTRCDSRWVKFKAS